MNWVMILLGVAALLIAIVVWIFIKNRRDFAYHQRISHGKNSATTVSIGIFHPYANGGGGGERVLYGALIALVEQFTRSRTAPKKSPQPMYSLQLILYSGDDGFSAEQLIGNAATHFNLPELIELRVAKYVQLVPLRQRDLLNPSQYPRLTLMRQGIAQFRLGLEAFRESRKFGLYPQFWLDTLSCPFSYVVAKSFGCTVMAYIHFPMISTDMMGRVQKRESGITNEESIAASHSRSMLKYVYYRLFAAVYGVVGRFCSDITMVNSTWTHNHIQKLWGKAPFIVYPGCGSIQEYMKFDLEHRDQMALSLSQFRPEKNHLLQLQSLKVLLTDHAEEMASKFPDFKLVIIGSCPTLESENLVKILKKEAV